MSSNVNLLSVGAGSTAKVSVKASNRTASSQGSDFSKTLDQAQQARSRDTAKPESDYKSVAKDESTKAEQPEATKPEAADSRAKADAANAANAAAKACQGIVNGLNTMVDTVTKKSCVLTVEDGILTIREA